MKPLAANSMIQNRYLIVQPIGKGGMGEVYLAVDQRLGSAVAIKRTFFKENEALGNAFEREARILARLRHPVLPKVIDHFMENGDQFLVMEHITGDDLAKRLEKANKGFPLSWVMFWADQMLDALNYLHSHEPPIIHRDIKPQNLKLTDDNHIVLLDFGLSKDFDSNSSGNPLNSASVAGYSPHFAAMEQIRGTGTDGRSDIYSLSATLYQLMTNTIPADALTRADALLGGAKDPIIPLYDLNAEIPPAVSDVILKGVAIRQNERYSTAVEMQRDLRRAFNKGNAAVADETLVMSGGAAPTLPKLPQPDIAELVTKTRAVAGSAGVDVSPRLDGVPRRDESKPSELKTEILSAPVAEIAESKPSHEIVEPPPPTIAVAAPVASSPPPLTSRPQQGSPAKVKKSSSKVGLLIGGLAGLFLLAAATIGGGWYVYRNFYMSATPVVSTSPPPASAASPSPGSNSMAGSNQDRNAGSEGPNSNTANTNQAPTTTGSPAPQITTKSTPVRAQQTPAAKATPKPKARDDRTVILP